MYTYILAPKTSNNVEQLRNAISVYPDIYQENRFKQVWKKSTADILNAEGQPVVNLGAEYLYLKVTTSEFSIEQLQGVSDWQTFTVDTQPFNEYWL